LYSYRLSYFLIMLPAAILPVWWSIRTGRAWYRYRDRPGFCRRCGYDLRASKVRCPECGMEIPAGAPFGPKFAIAPAVNALRSACQVQTKKSSAFSLAPGRGVARRVNAARNRSGICRGGV
jgi:hypothetical protein